MTLAGLLITLGVLFLAGLAADALGRRTRLPRVTLLLGCGIVAGGAGFDLIPAQVQAWYEPVSVIALTMVAFLLGNSMHRDKLRGNGRTIIWVSLAIVLVTLAIVALGLRGLGMAAPAALLLGAIATATDPAATEDAIRQSGVQSRFADLLRGIVAVDDAWGLLVFSLVAALAHGLGGTEQTGILTEVIWEIGGAIGLGCALGFPAAYLTGRLETGEPQQAEALGIVFLAAGLAQWMNVSFLLAGMVAGTIVANFARHHDRAFHEIENIRWPFMMVFFLLAGASLDVGMLMHVGVIGLAYIGLRTVGRVLGGQLGGAMARQPANERRWTGMALLPQAGVAVGMALVAAQEFPEYADIILPLTIGTTVAFELVGPLATLWAVRRVTEVGDRNRQA